MNDTYIINAILSVDVEFTSWNSIWVNLPSILRVFMILKSSYGTNVPQRPYSRFSKAIIAITLCSKQLLAC